MNCAWCGQPLGDDNTQLVFMGLAGQPQVGWHDIVCWVGDPVREALTQLRAEPCDRRDEAIEMNLATIEGRGPGRVTRKGEPL